MATIAISTLNLNTTANEWALTGADLLKEENVTFLEELQACGDGKGDMLRLKAGEQLSFDPFEETIFVKRMVTFREKDYPTLAIVAHSSFQGDIELPMSYFRRLPAFEEDRAKLYDGHPLTERLAQASIGDLGRARLLIQSSTVTVETVTKLFRQTFTTSGGKSVRDDEDTVRKKGETITCYQVK